MYTYTRACPYTMPYILWLWSFYHTIYYILLLYYACYIYLHSYVPIAMYCLFVIVNYIHSYIISYFILAYKGIYFVWVSVSGSITCRGRSRIFERGGAKISVDHWSRGLQPPEIMGCLSFQPLKFKGRGTWKNLF